MLAQTIKQARIRHELTQQELADKVGCKRQRIVNIENGKGASTDMLFKVAEVLGCDILCVSKKSRYHKTVKDQLAKDGSAGRK